MVIIKKALPSGGLDGKACSKKKKSDSRRRAGNETRTRDPNLGKVVLYQLSYSRLFGLQNYKKLLFYTNFFVRFFCFF